MDISTPGIRFLQVNNKKQAWYPYHACFAISCVMRRKTVHMRHPIRPVFPPRRH